MLFNILNRKERWWKSGQLLTINTIQIINLNNFFFIQKRTFVSYIYYQWGIVMTVIYWPFNCVYSISWTFLADQRCKWLFHYKI